MCKAIGGYLAEPKTQQQDAFVKAVAANHTRSSRTWIGGEDLLEEGKWFWSYSGEVITEYTGEVSTNCYIRI